MIKIKSKNKNKVIRDIVRKYYLDMLQREPDENGLSFYVEQLKKNSIKESDLPKIFMESYEYHLLHPINVDKKITTTNQWMKLDWNARAKNAEYFSGSIWGESENEYWISGKQDCNSILGLKTPQFDIITQNMNPKKMKVLEIGCGPGRILVPMSKIFGEVIGVDISSEMIQMAKQNTKDIPNCTVYENSNSDLTQFSNDYFDFCYSNTVFQHIPEKEIVRNYIFEVARVLKPGSVFGFHVRGNTNDIQYEVNTWNGAQFSIDEINQIVSTNAFEVLEEKKILEYNDTFHWLMCKLKK